MVEKLILDPLKPVDSRCFPLFFYSFNFAIKIAKKIWIFMFFLTFLGFRGHELRIFSLINRNKQNPVITIIN